MTHSWRLYGSSFREVARLIQKKVRSKLGLYTTVGIGDNPVQAKIALDIYAKHSAIKQNSILTNFMLCSYIKSP